jgi:hypothetical protein
VAGFRIGRGRDNRTPQQPPRQQPYGQQPLPPYGGQPYPPQGPPPQQQWPGQGGTGGGHGEPEYFADPSYPQQQPPHGGGRQHGQHPGQQQYGQQHGQHPAPPYGAPQGPGGYSDQGNDAGHTRAFSISDEQQYGYGDGQTYRSGTAGAPPAGPRLPWKQLLSGIVMRPGPTFMQMRDYPVWGTALAVTFLYGLLAVFGMDGAREDAINSTLSKAVPIVLSTGVAFVICGLILGAVTHTLARQLGGDGSWQPTVGLSMLVMTITDSPRLLFAVFLGGENALVQVLGWVTWLAAGALFTSLISKTHDLPWPKALGASAIQLVALLSIIKLGTL